MKLNNKIIFATNTAIVILSLVLLIKTSDSLYIFGFDKSTIAAFIFAKFPFANIEISALSASVLAAYIFYLINTYLPKAKQEKEYKEQISPLIEEIVSKASAIFRLINEQSGQYIKFPVNDYSEICEISSHINFGDIYQGSVVIDSYTPPIIPSYKEIEYHITRCSNECLSKIYDIRTKNILLDSILLKRLQDLESNIKLTLNTFALISNSRSRQNGFRQVADIYKKVYDSAQNLMYYYNKNIKHNKEPSKCDIWFNPNTKNYENTAPPTNDQVQNSLTSVSTTDAVTARDS